MSGWRGWRTADAVAALKRIGKALPTLSPDAPIFGPMGKVDKQAPAQKPTQRKYGNVPVDDPTHGHFDSGGEFARFGELLLLQKAGMIRKLRRQQRVELLAQRLENWRLCEPPSKAIITRNPNQSAKAALTEKGNVLTWKCDYAYEELIETPGCADTWQAVFEDFKGFDTKDSMTRRAWVRAMGATVRVTKTGKK